MPVELHWLPNPAASWRSDVASLIATIESDDRRWEQLVALSNQRIDYAQTVRLDKALQDLFKSSPPAGLATKPVKLAVLSSSTARTFNSRHSDRSASQEHLGSDL